MIRIALPYLLLQTKTCLLTGISHDEVLAGINLKPQRHHRHKIPSRLGIVIILTVRRLQPAEEAIRVSIGCILHIKKIIHQQTDPDFPHPGRLDGIA